MTESLLRSESARSAGDTAQLAPSAIATTMVFEAAPARAWKGLMFYEQIDVRPPLYLRLLLPVPIRTEGRKSEVGDEARCLYEGGHLIKRVTEIDRGRLYRFEVIEQALAVGGSMRLMGGSYSLRPLPGERTEVTLSTNYRSARGPRWLWKPLEAAVGHLFHLHILAAMRRSLAKA